jgi:hypothetical protein
LQEQPLPPAGDRAKRDAMSNDEISRLAAELFQLHRAGDDAAHDRLLDSLTPEQRRLVGGKFLDIGEKMCRLETALERDDATAAAAVAEIAGEIARFTSRVRPKSKLH